MDADCLGGYQKILNQGLIADDDAMARDAYETWNAMLAQYEAPQIDVAVDEELMDYVAQRKREIPEAWYC